MKDQLSCRGINFMGINCRGTVQPTQAVKVANTLVVHFWRCIHLKGITQDIGIQN